MKSKLLLFLLIAYLALPFFGYFSLLAQSDTVLIEVLARPDCAHCQDEEKFLKELKTQRDDFIYHIYNIYKPEGKQLWNQLTELEKLPKATPITLIGQTIIQGFGTPETTGREIEQLIDHYQDQPQTTIQEYLNNKNKGQIHTVTDGTCIEDTEECQIVNPPLLVTIPLINKSLDLKSYSLPTLSIILGFIDGFNPCAMWVLVSFLIILAQVGNRRKMWTFVGLFLLAEAIMYTLILTVWFTTWDFVGLDKFVTPIVGLIAIGGGIFFLYEWKTSDPGECKVTNLEQRAKISQRIKQLAAQPLTWLTILGIITLAFSVNIIEFACSIGIPQAFTKILEINNLSLISSSFYIFLYILFYMIDDFIVFGIALYSFEKIGLTGKYSKLSNLIGGILMLILGALLILKPQWLMFT